MISRLKRKVLIIGIDGGTFDVILPLAKSGRIPNLSKLIQDGAHGTLLSTIPPVTAPAWSSFIMGSNPGQHGVFHFFKADPHEKKSQKVLMNLTHMRGIPFWKVLNKQGCRVGLMNIPLTYPPDSVDGFMISGMLVPQNADDYVYPLELRSRLDDYQVDLNGLMVQGKWQDSKLAQDRQKLIADIHDLTKMRAHNALKLIKSEIWDVFMVVFVGSDRASHFFWKDQANGKSPSSIVEDYYALLDSRIGRLLDSVGDDACKLVISDHGFGPAPTKRISGYLLSKYLGGTKFAKNFRLTYLKNRILSLFGKEREGWFDDIIDFRHSRIVFRPLYANFIGFWVTSNQEQHVETVQEYNSVRQELMEKLEVLTDPISGKRLVEKVHLRESLYRGPHAAEAPDLVAQFAYDYRMAFSPFKKNLVNEFVSTVRTGEHRREGILIASGPGIKPGRIEGEIFIQDVSPTILYLSGAPIPSSYDARLITELFKDDYMALNVPQYQDLESEAEEGKNDAHVNSPEDTEDLKKLLRSLGYL